MAPNRTIRVGLLVCGTLGGAVGGDHGDYDVVYSQYWKNTTPANSHVRLVIDRFHLKKMEFPEEDKLDEYDIFMVTGALTSANSDDIPWVKDLLALLKRLINDHPKVKICGICFGHQIVCRALGGKCESTGKWEVGPASIDLSDVGKSILGVDRIALEEIHGDHVPVESFEEQLASGELHLIGSSSNTRNEGIIKFYPSENDSKTHRDIHVLTLQGHPEFSESIITGLMRKAAPSLGESLANDYWGEQGGEYDDEPEDKAGTGRRWQKTHGLDVVSRALWKMVGVEAPVEATEAKTAVPQRPEFMGAISRVESQERMFASSWLMLTGGFNHVSNLLWRIVGMALWW